MSYSNVQEYNNYLIENKKEINFIDYVKNINKMKFNIDIDFIDELIELDNKNDFSIHHSLLQKYGLISLNTSIDDIKQMLEQNEFIENEDYKVINTKSKTEYYLHPITFKLCLMRTLKTNKYINYYLLLEECYKYYNDYQIKLKDKYIIELEKY